MYFAAISMGLTLLAHGTGRSKDPEARGITPVVVIAGSDSACSKAECTSCRNRKEWATVWQKHIGDRAGRGRQVLPEVDFESFMVVAIFQGESSQNYGLHIVEVLERASSVRVRFQPLWYQIPSSPSSESDELKLRTQSFAFLVIPRAEKKIIVENNVQRVIDSPPVWKSVAELPKPQ